MSCIKEALSVVTYEEQKRLERFFLNCPSEVMDSMKLIQIPAGRTVSRAGEAISSVYILLKGSLQGIDEQFDGRVYTFLSFKPVTIVDDFEVLAGIVEYRVTINTTRDSILLMIPAHFYLKWLKHDVNALFMRIQEFAQDMTEQSCRDRQYLFLHGVDRLALYLVNIYESHVGAHGLRLKKTRNELSNELGYSLKTLNRSVKKLQEEDFIQIDSGKIFIDEFHYERLKQFVKQRTGTNHTDNHDRVFY